MLPRRRWCELNAAYILLGLTWTLTCAVTCTLTYTLTCAVACTLTYTLTCAVACALTYTLTCAVTCTLACAITFDNIETFLYPLNHIVDQELWDSQVSLT